MNTSAEVFWTPERKRRNWPCKRVGGVVSGSDGPDAVLGPSGEDVE